MMTNTDRRTFYTDLIKKRLKDIFKLNKEIETSDDTILNITHIVLDLNTIKCLISIQVKEKQLFFTLMFTGTNENKNNTKIQLQKITNMMETFGGKLTNKMR